ncbi:MAG: hypothetical protein ABI467_32535 [Kofleriaceae bacterium]
MPTTPAELARTLQIMVTTRDGPARAPRLRLLRSIPAAIRIQTIVDALPRTKHARWELPFILHRIATPAMPGFHGVFTGLLTDPDPGVREGAAEVLSNRPPWAATLVPALASMVAIELPRKRGTLAIGEALRALAAAQTKEAEAVLVGLRRRRFALPWYRAQWLHALAHYRSPAAKRVLAAFSNANDLSMRTSALGGLVRNGDRRALASLRALLDITPVERACNVAWDVHFVLKVPLAIDEAQLVRLKKWWDAHPEQIEKRFRAAHKKPT